MNSQIPSPDDGRVLTLRGELTIARAEELKAALSESLQGAASVRIQLADVGAVDLSCLQLLCSAHRTAAVLGKSLTLEGEVPPMIRETMKYAGFTRQKGCAFSPHTNCLGCGGD
ncbi:MAG: STAS domain-containing protein [Pseudomonadota bacterium]